MGIMDAFNKEDRLEITVNQLYGILKEAGRAELFRNGVKNMVPYADILRVLDGDADELVEKERGALCQPCKEFESRQDAKK